jgi:hypothetical protein
MQQTSEISFRELSRLEVSRLENSLSENAYRNNHRKETPRENRLPVILVAIVGVVLIAISFTLLFMVGSMLFLNPLAPLW